MRPHCAVPGVELARILVLGVPDFGRDDAGRYRAGDALRDLVLHGKHVGQVAIVAVGPEMVPGFAIDQLRRDPHPIAGAPDAAFDHVTHAQLARHLADVHGRTLVGERRAARNHKKLAVARQVGDDVLGDPIGEIFLFGIAAHIGERQHRYRRLLGHTAREWSRSIASPDWLYGLRAEENAVSAHWARYVLDLLLAHVGEREIELVAHLVPDDPADADPARLGQGFQTRRDVHAVAVDVVLVDDDVAEVQPDAILDAPLRRHLDIALGHSALDLDSTAHGIDDAGEFDQDAVAGELDGAPAMLLDLRIDQLAPMALQRGERAFLVNPHQARVTGDIPG